MLQIPGPSRDFVDPGTALVPLSSMAPIPDPLPPTKRMAKQLVKTQFCKHHLRGYCRYQDKCAYAHHAEELMPRPNLQKTKICANFLAGTCSNELCTYAHGLTELRLVHRDDAPTEVRNSPPSSCPMDRHRGAQSRDRQHDRQLHHTSAQSRQQQVFSQQHAQMPFQLQQQQQRQQPQVQQPQLQQQRSPQQQQQQQLPYRPPPIHQQQQQAHMSAWQMSCDCQGSVEPLPLLPDEDYKEGELHQKLQQMASMASTRAAEQVLQMAVRRLLQATGSDHESTCQQQQQQAQHQATPQKMLAVAQGGHSSFQQHPQQQQQQQQLPQSFPQAQAIARQMQPTPDASWQHPQQGCQQHVSDQQRSQDSMDATWQQQQWQLQVLPAALSTHSQEAHQLLQPQYNHLQLLDLGSLATEVSSPSAVGVNEDVALLRLALTEIVELLQEEDDHDREACESNALTALTMRWFSLTSAALTAQSKMYMLEGKCLLDHDRRPELSFSNEQSILYLFMRSPHWRNVFPMLVRRVTMVLASRLSPDFLPPPGRCGNRSDTGSFRDELLYHESRTCSDLP